MAKKITEKKDVAISYDKKGDNVVDVKIKLKPVNAQTLLSLCETLLASIIELEGRIAELEADNADIVQKQIVLRDNISQLNGFTLKHETELFSKP